MKKKLIGILIGILLLTTILPAAGLETVTYSDDGTIFAFGKLSQPPSTPVISGPNVAGPGIMLEFSAVSSDPEEEDIYYMWDWGDGNITDWLGPYNSGAMITTNHSWSEKGDYDIIIKAKDINGNESSWSKPHNISIATQIEFSNLQLGFIYLRTFFTNNSYAYIYLLETLGLTVVLSDNGLSVEAIGTDAVDTAKFELVDILWEDQEIQEDDNSSDGFSAKFDISSGIFQLTVYAYDENGTMIDMDKLDYLIFLDLTSDSSQGSQQIRHISKIRQRLQERLRTRIQERILDQ